MKALTSVVFLAVGSVVAFSCASSEDKDVPNENDRMVDAQQPEADGATTQPEDETSSSTSAPDADGEITSNTGAPDADDDDSESVEDAGSDVEPDATNETKVDAGACELPEAYPPSCEACLGEECNDQFLACYCDEDCGVQLVALHSCFADAHSFEEPSDDPAAAWDTCMNAIGGDDASPLLFDVLSCVGRTYEAPLEDAEDDAYNRVDGDDVCTAACFSLYNFDEI